MTDAEKHYIKFWSTAFTPSESEAKSQAADSEITIEGDTMTERDTKDGAISKFTCVADDEKP